MTAFYVIPLQYNGPFNSLMKTQNQPLQSGISVDLEGFRECMLLFQLIFNILVILQVCVTKNTQQKQTAFALGTVLF